MYKVNQFILQTKLIIIAEAQNKFDINLYGLGEEGCESATRYGVANDVSELLKIAVVCITLTWRASALTSRLLSTVIQPITLY